MSELQSLQPQLEQIEQLITQLDACDGNELRESAIALVQEVLELHRRGLDQLLQEVTRIAPQQGALRRLAMNPQVSSLLLLHGLHPVELSERVEEALKRVRPFLASHGGDVQLVEINDGHVRLQLTGNCHGCPSSIQTMSNLIEEALYEAAPDISSLVVDGLNSEPLADFVSVDSLATKVSATS